MNQFEKLNTNEYRHGLIKEFRESLALIDYKIPQKTDGMVILSGEEFVTQIDRLFIAGQQGK